MTIDFNKLPKLTSKQNACVFYFFTSELGNKIQSYKKAYDCSNMLEATIAKEANEFFKNPTITPWIEYYQQNLVKHQLEEVKYSFSDFFNELDRIRAKTEDSSKTVSVALKAIELKGKAFNYLDKDNQQATQVVVNMGNVKVDGKELTPNIGEQITND